MKVAVSGAHGTGKTTLLDALSHVEGNAFHIIPEIPRLLIDLAGDATFLRRGRNTVINQIAIIAGQMALEERSSVDSGLVICDRTVADHWAYTSLLFPGDLLSPALQLVDQAVHEWLGTYDRIFLLRPEFALLDDGTREDSIAFQTRVDTFLHSYYAEAGVAITYLPGSLDERTTTFLREVNHES